MNQRMGLAMMVSWSTLVQGCSAGTAAVGLTDCGDSMTCCIKKHPFDPEGACGATATEIQTALGAGVAVGATVHLLTTDGAGEAEETGDPDEGWREHCRDNYVRCKDQKKPRWIGNCYDCFR